MVCRKVEAESSWIVGKYFWQLEKSPIVFVSAFVEFTEGLYCEPVTIQYAQAVSRRLDINIQNT
ncbi:hypothetical protein J6590_103282 [Homalodisca vitripennis]|nr:hypothetical protein J6590_103282 [Homalodisca vitripennis]